MKYLITGGAGFIGSHLAEYLLSEPENHTVVCLDDLSAGALENIKPLAVKYPSRLEHRTATVSENGITRELVAEADFVFHLAARAGVEKIMRLGVESIDLNYRAAAAVLDACVTAGPIRFSGSSLGSRRKIPVLFASSSEVYGCLQVPFDETDPCVLPPGPRWSYAAGKLLAEHLALAWHRENDLPVIVARFFNTVGPRQSPSHKLVLSTFVRQALANEPITVFGGGTSRRAFCHVRDTVEAIVRLSRTPAAFGEIVNVGRGVIDGRWRQRAEVRSVFDLAHHVRARLKSASEIVHVSLEEAYPPGYSDTQERLPDCTKLARLTGFVAERSLDEMIDDIANELRG